MKILVFGAGAVGSVLAGFLARMGHDVSLLGRKPHLNAIAKNGLHITGIWGDYRMKAFEFFTDVSQIVQKAPVFDLIILTVKSYDTQEATEQISSFMGPQTQLVSFQNGLGNIEKITSKIPAERYFVGRAIFGAQITEPGTVRVTVCADALVIGPAVIGKGGAEKIAQLFNLSKLEARAVADILPVIWAKVIYNCALNAICTLNQMPYGDILKNPQTKRQMEEVVRECYAVGLRKRVKLEPPDAESFLRKLIGQWILDTAAHYPSMLQDLKNGKRLDIDSLNGAIVDFGRELGVPTPINEELVHSIRLSTPKP